MDPLYSLAFGNAIQTQKESLGEPELRMPGFEDSEDANNIGNARKVLLSFRRWTIVFILGALVTLLKLRYKAEEIITILKSHPVSMKTFISVLFLDLAALYASHKPSMCDSHSSLDKIGFLLDALLGTVVLLAIDQFLGWLFFIVWTLLVIAMAYELYKHYKQFLGSLCASILQRLPMSHNMMALHSTWEVELQQSATHSPSEEVNDEEEEVAVVV